MRKEIDFTPYEEVDVKEICADGTVLCDLYGNKSDDNTWEHIDKNVSFPVGGPVLFLEANDYQSIVKAYCRDGNLVIPEDHPVPLDDEIIYPTDYKKVSFPSGYPERGEQYRMNLVETDDEIQVSWDKYVPDPVEPEPEGMQEQLVAFARMSINTMALSDEQSLSVMDLYPAWEEFMGQEVEAGIKMKYNEKLWKVLQKHTVQEQYKPGPGMESLYAEIVESHSGTEDDPIPYSGNMALEKDKYYTQNGVVYHCTRDTGIPVYQSLAELVGIYVEVVE